MFARLECELNQFKSAFQIPKARVAAFAIVDQDIDDAKRLILSMHTHSKMLVPISILPCIFRFNSFSEQALFAGGGYLSRAYADAGVRRDDSTLWTHSRNKNWIAERPSRARDVPLITELCRSLGKDTFSLFLPHVSHTREPYFPNLSSLHSEFMQDISIQKARRWNASNSACRITPPQWALKHVVGHSFFKGSLPKLRIFCISQILFPLPLVHRGRLKQLKAISSKRCPPCP